MDFNDKILDFLDGSSSLEEDKALLSSLADNPEMLSKMKKMMAMEASIAQNPEYFEPTVATSAKVFENLGFKYGAREGFLAGLGAYFTGSKLLTAVTSSVITILLLSTFYYFYIGDDIPSDDDNLKNIAQTALVNDNMTPDRSDNPNNILDKSNNQNYAEYNIDNSQANQKIITKYINKTEFVTTDNNGNIVKFSSLEELKDYLQIINNYNDDNYQSSSNNINLINDLNNQSSINSTNIENNTLLSINKSEIQKNDLFNGIRSASGFGQSEIQILNNQSQNFNFNAPRGVEFSLLSSLNSSNLEGLSENLVNFKISWMPVKYSWADVGLELTRENFLQNFTNNVDASRSIDYTQNPALWTIGLSARKNLLETSGFWSPYVQLSAGGAFSNEMNFYPGFFYRGALATKLSPEMLPFSMNLGVQYTGLSTNQFGEFFQSNNLSLILGVNF